MIAYNGPVRDLELKLSFQNRAFFGARFPSR